MNPFATGAVSAKRSPQASLMLGLPKQAPRMSGSIGTKWISGLGRWSCLLAWLVLADECWRGCPAKGVRQVPVAPIEGIGEEETGGAGAAALPFTLLRPPTTSKEGSTASISMPLGSVDSCNQKSQNAVCRLVCSAMVCLTRHTTTVLSIALDPPLTTTTIQLLTITFYTLYDSLENS